MKKAYLALILIGIAPLHAMEKKKPLFSRRKSTSGATNPVKKTQSQIIPKRPVSILGVFDPDSPLSQSFPEGGFLRNSSSPTEGGLTQRIKDPDLLKRLREQEGGVDEFDTLVEGILNKQNSLKSNPCEEFENLLVETENCKLVNAYYQLKILESQSKDDTLALYRALYKKLCEVEKNTKGASSNANSTLLEQVEELLQNLIPEGETQTLHALQEVQSTIALEIFQANSSQMKEIQEIKKELKEQKETMAKNLKLFIEKKRLSTTRK